MSTPLTKLTDADLERVNHLIRRDAASDLAIAADVEKCIGEKIGPTDAARAMVISRYRKSPAYTKWLHAWENRDADLKKATELQRQRFELISHLVQGDNDEGFETISKSIQARLLTLAAEADDEALIEAASGKGWIKNTLVVANQSLRDIYRRKAEDLKREIEKMLSAPKSSNIKTADVIAKVDDIMGLKEKVA